MNRFSIETPAVPSALAVLRLSGNIASVVTPAPPDDRQPPVLAKLLGIDHGLLGRSPDGSCWFTPHGSPGALDSIRDALLARGWKEQPAGSPDPDLLSALSSTGTNLYQREALRLLPTAPSLASVRLLLAATQVTGEPDGFSPTHMLADWPMVAPWLRVPVVLITGAPNVGKSTLFNRLAADRSAITSPVAGTTRDLLRAVWPLPNGAVVEIVDSPGLRGEQETDSPGERAGIRLAREALQSADMRIVCQPRHLPRPLVEGLHVATMLDLGRPPAWADLSVSAITGEGMDELAWGIAGTLFPPLPVGRVLPLTAEMARDSLIPGFGERWFRSLSADTR